MDVSSIKVSSNWSHIGGCTFPQCIQELAADPDIFIKPDINKLVDEEKSILLSREQSSDHCELYINKYPHYKIQAVSFVCNVLKVEIFQGPIMEYMETIYGIVVDETDDKFKTYRYDVEIEKSGVTNLTLRFLSSSSEVCIFGFILHTSPNPNGITSLLPYSHCVNAQNVSKTETKSKYVSEKCGRALELSSNTTLLNALPLNQHFKEKFNIAIDDEPSTTNKELNKDILDNLKHHIDKRFDEILMHVNTKLAEMEHRQNKKLDKLLHVLEYNK